MTTNQIIISIKIIIIPPAPALVVLATYSCKKDAGKLAIIPTVINNDIPLPTPLSVIRSPNHMAKTVPAVRSIIDDIQKVGPVTKNAAGVMPIIFAQAIMFLPMALARKFPFLSELQDPFGLWYNVIFAFLIVIFSFFYTAITIPTNKMADDLKKSGGFIPGILSLIHI